MKRLLCIWLPNWPIQRLAAARSELSECAFVLHTRIANRGERIVACSPQAAAHGIRIGIPVAEAGALWNAAQRPADVPLSTARRSHESSEDGTRTASALTRPMAATKAAWLSEPCGQHSTARSAMPQRCAHGALRIQTETLTLHPLPYDPAADEAELLRLAEWCEQFSPTVGLAEPSSWSRTLPARRESLLLDVTGLGRWFGSEERLAEHVVAAFTQRGYRTQIAIADTIGAAWALAHLETSGLQSPASSLQPPYRITPPGQHLAALRPLPVELLRLDERAVDLLHQLGIVAIESLLRLPRASLSSRLGQEVLHRLDQAAGIVDELLVPHRPAPVFAAQWSLEHPTAQRLVLERGLRQVMEQLVRQLAEKNRAALQVEIRLDCVSLDVSSAPPAQRFGLQLFRPLADAEHLLELLNMQWEQTRLPGPVRRIAAQVLLAVPREQQQQTLFETPEHARQREFARLVDRLSSRLGPHRVLRAREEADVQPECAYQLVPLVTDQAPAARSRAPSQALSREPPGPSDRPLRLYRPPHPLHMLAVGPEGPPVRFRDRHQWHEVAQVWGPERMETGWWRGRTVRRDYYRVETRSGQRFWLFRELHDGSWFLHGVFT